MSHLASHRADFHRAPIALANPLRQRQRARWDTQLDLHPVTLTLRSLAWMAGTAGRAQEGGSELGWRELENRLQAFDGFQAGGRLVPDGAGRGPLPAALARVESRSPFARLWLTEGVGHGYAESFLSTARRPPIGLLHDAPTESIPPQALVPLHAGMGLAFAFRWVDEANATQRMTRSSVEAFLGLCRRNAAAGYDGVCFEALGLAIRTLRPAMLDRMDDVLSGFDGRLRELFWHGVGRGLYFLPSNLSPSLNGRWTAFDKSRFEPRRESDRLSATAGLAWALTLVNVRHPEIVEVRWRRHYARAGDRFTDGMIAALLIWHQSNGLDDHLARFLRYENPLWSSPQREAWRRQLTVPCLQALTQTLQPRDIDRLFRGGAPLAGWRGASDLQAEMKRIPK